MIVPVVTTSIEVDIPIDARLVFLTRAAARLTLVEAGMLDLDTAVADLIPPCACARDVVERWERQYPPRRQWKRRS
jgi:hypothetical protein